MAADFRAEPTSRAADFRSLEDFGSLVAPQVGQIVPQFDDANEIELPQNLCDVMNRRLAPCLEHQQSLSNLCCNIVVVHEGFRQK